MSHFPEETWVNWVRSTVEDDEVKRHLDAGCEQCKRSLEIWKSVREIVTRDEAYEPPPTVLSAAQAAFETRRPVREERRVIRTLELLFDSLRSPLPEGIRAVAQPARYLSYRAGDFFVDVRIEDRTNSEMTSVTGQFQTLESGLRSVDGLEVVLTQGEARLIETRTNRFGEFAFEMDGDREHMLSISVGDELAVVLPIGGEPG